MLDDQIPTGTRILECGCGTGQLTNYLSIAYRTVVGTDMCLNSLKLANDFKQKNKLDRAHFFQMNLFRPFFKPESFDLVISNGVLHHTSDPRLAFQSISRLVKPGETGKVAALLLDSAARAAAANVRVNLPSIGDDGYASAVTAELDQRLQQVQATADRARERVARGTLRKPEAESRPAS